MDRPQIEALLKEVQRRRTGVTDALERLKDLPFEDLGFAKLDHHRALRTGMPEVIFAAGKTPARWRRFSRAWPKPAAMCWPHAHRARLRRGAVLQSPARPITKQRAPSRLRRAPAPAGRGTIGVVCAGTSDLPVAEEAAITARLMGNTVELIADVGVAGIHRLLAQKQSLQTARVLIVCAGMEGALPTVVAGLVNAPVLAVPTSVGYGASFGGVAALLGMLNTCSPNVSVVNIDNGFGAACIASLINHME